MVRLPFTPVDRTKPLALPSSCSHLLTKLWYPRDLSHRGYYYFARQDYSTATAYAPTEGSPDPDKDLFYDQLSNIVQSISIHNELMLLGDFNAVTRPRTQGFENVVGRFGFATPNDNTRWITINI